MVSADALRSRLTGVFVPLVTPFDADGELSASGLREICRHVTDGGAAGIIPGDLVGELYALTLEERRLLIRESVAAGCGRLIVISVTADSSLTNAIELARVAREAGADAIKLAQPCSYAPPETAMLDVYRRIDDAAGMPFLIESSDELTIPLSVISALCERPHFVGLEELGSDVARLDRLYREFGERLAILPSGETAFLFLTLMGARALIASEANFAPAVMGAFLAACQARDLDRALDLFGKRRRYRDLFRARLASGVPAFTPYAKAALGLLGFSVGKPRLPHESLTPEETDRLRQVLREEFGLDPPAIPLDGASEPRRGRRS